MSEATAPTPAARSAPVSSAPPRSKAPIVILLVALLGFGGYRGYQIWLAHQPLEIGGTVEVRTVQVASRTGGRVRNVLVHEGDEVRAGQPLVELDRVEVEARRDEAQAAVDIAQAQLDRALNGPREVEIAASRARVANAQAVLTELTRGARREDIDRARAQLAAAESQLANARTSFERATTLLQSQSISRQDYDAAAMQQRVAEGNRDAARSVLEALQRGSRPEDIAQARSRVAEATAQLENTRLGSRDEDIRAARAQLAQARARLALAQINLDETTIRAPTDCRVEALDLRPGDILGPNQPAVTLVERDQMFVRAYVPETELGLVHVGDTVEFTVDTFGKRRFPARVEHVNEVGEYTPRNVQTADERANQVFLVRLGIRENRELLRAGMAATVHLPRRSR
jgi:multidrug resistance efflux pump